MDEHILITEQQPKVLINDDDYLYHQAQDLEGMKKMYLQHNSEEIKEHEGVKTFMQRLFPSTREEKPGKDL